jgi:hypothetical protein
MYLLVVFWFCTFQAISTAAPYWTIDDADILKRQLKETVANSHSDVKQAYYAAKLLSRFNDSLNICSSEIIVNGEYDDLNSLFYFSLLNKYCKQNPKLSQVDFVGMAIKVQFDSNLFVVVDLTFCRVRIYLELFKD